MVHKVLVSDQAYELDQHSGQSRNGDRRLGCSDVGRCSCKRHPGHLWRFPRRICPDGPAHWLSRRRCPRSPDKHGHPGGEPNGRPGHGDGSHIRRCEAVPDCHSTPRLRAAPAPTVAVAHDFAIAFVLAQAVEIALDVALANGFRFDVALTLAFAYDVALALVLAIADSMRPPGLRWALGILRRGAKLRHAPLMPGHY
jgi:hypothetical protein